jgi:hypothetical protein
MNRKILSEKIRKTAELSKIDIVGFANASEFVDYAINQHQRRDPRLTMPNAKSIIVAGIYIGGLVMQEWKDKFFLQDLNKLS